MNIPASWEEFRFSPRTKKLVKAVKRLVKAKYGTELEISERSIAFI